ncbi:MAG: N-acetyltransferase, partial [Actinobacteria bacterium]|nr:N-acetyltransferase [Actinomycetota bacterium]
MSILIRPITQRDTASWLELFKEYIIFYKSNLSDQQLELTWQRIHSDFNIKGLLAEKNGEI